MEKQKLTAIYYPNSYIENNRSIASYALYFDELRMVTLIDDATDQTNRLANLPKQLYINSFGGDPDSEYINNLKGYYNFAWNYKELIGKFIFYEPHLLGNKINTIVDKLLGGAGIPTEEFHEFLLGECEEQKAIQKFQDDFPNSNNDILLRVAPTALQLSRKNNWQLVSDIQKLPIPYFSNTIRNADQLSSIIAEECLTLNLPYPKSCNSQELLELRENLSTELVPFRNMMLKAAAKLREQIENEFDQKTVREEANFFVKTNINPIISELERRIKLEQGKLLRKIFGRIVEYVPLAVNAFISPSIDNIYKTLGKASKDMEDLLLTEHEKTILKDPGISFLLKAKEKMG